MTTMYNNSAFERLKTMYPKQLEQLGSLSTWKDPMHLTSEDIEKLERARKLESKALLNIIDKNKVTAHLITEDMDNLIFAHLLLNERCNDDLTIAPAFRPMARLGKIVSGSGDEELYRKLMIVDFHWLMCKGFVPNDEKFNNIFNKGWMSLTDGDIHDFLSKNWKTKAKVAKLALSPSLEMECAYYCNKKIKVDRNRIMNTQRKTRLGELQYKLNNERLPRHLTHLKSIPEKCAVLTNVAAAMEISNVLSSKFTDKETLYWYQRIAGDNLLEGASITSVSKANPISRLRKRKYLVRKVWIDVP